MPKSRFLVILFSGLLALVAPQTGHAALVLASANIQPEQVSLVTKPGPTAAAFTVIDTTLHPARAGEPICNDSTLCQEWRQRLDDAQALLNFTALGPFGRMTFLVNFALIALGLLWATLARRSLRAAPARNRG